MRGCAGLCTQPIHAGEPLGFPHPIGNPWGRKKKEMKKDMKKILGHESTPGVSPGVGDPRGFHGSFPMGFPYPRGSPTPGVSLPPCSPVEPLVPFRMRE